MAFDNPIEGYSAPGLRAPEEPTSENAMERIAQEADYADKLAEIEKSIYETARLVDAGHYKHVRVNMRGVNGNAYNIMAIVLRGLVEAGAPLEHRKVFRSWCTSGDYENLLRVCARWVTIVDEPIDRGDAASAFERLGG
jgi:hypothetical protein